MKTKYTTIIVSAILLALICSLFFTRQVKAEENWLITAYCSCKKCCGKSNGISASRKPAQYGYMACNWLKFGTKVEIKGLGVFTVRDRGAKSLFGSKTNHIKHLDIWLPSHRQALNWGKRYIEVKVLE